MYYGYPPAFPSAYGYPQQLMPGMDPSGYYPAVGQQLDRTQCTVYVTGLNHQLREENILQLFSLCGTISNIRLCGEPDKASRFGFIEFLTHESALMAIGLSGISLGGSPIKIQQSKTAIQGPRLASLGGGPADPAQQERASRTLYVGGVDTRVSEAELAQHFSSCGVVTKLVLAGTTAQPTRFAFVEFSNAHEASMALSLTGTIIGDKPIKVSPSKTPINTPVKSAAANMGTRSFAGMYRGAPEYTTATQASQVEKKRKRSSSGSPEVSRHRNKSPEQHREKASRSKHSRSRSRSPSYSPSLSPSPSREQKTKAKGVANTQSLDVVPDELL